MEMTNSTFQGGDSVIKLTWALAIHLLKCVAKAKIDIFTCFSALKSGVSHSCKPFVLFRQPFLGKNTEGSSFTLIYKFITKRNPKFLQTPIQRRPRQTQRPRCPCDIAFMKIHCPLNHLFFHFFKRHCTYFW